MLSAVVLTKNEEKNIIDCLQSVSFCDEVIVIDDYSQDQTVEIVNKVSKVHKVYKVFERHLNNDFSGQRNFGLEKAKGDWALFVDADERMTKELTKEIKQITDNSKQKTDGYFLTRQDYFLGKWLRYGETGNIKLLRLAKKNAGKWEGKVHEEWKIKGKTGKLDKPLLHYPHQTVGEFLQEINFYSTIRAQQLYEQGKKTNFWQISVYPIGKFLQNYIIRLGFLDSIQGLILAILMSFHSFLVRSKLYFLCHSRKI